MDETITLYSNDDLTSPAREPVEDGLDMPGDEETGKYEYQISREAFRTAYKNWDSNAHPLLSFNDPLAHTDILLSKTLADRVHDAVQKRAASVQLF